MGLINQALQNFPKDLGQWSFLNSCMLNNLIICILGLKIIKIKLPEPLIDLQIKLYAFRLAQRVMKNCS